MNSYYWLLKSLEPHFNHNESRQDVLYNNVRIIVEDYIRKYKVSNDKNKTTTIKSLLKADIEDLKSEEYNAVIGIIAATVLSTITLLITVISSPIFKIAKENDSNIPIWIKILAILLTIGVAIYGIKTIQHINQGIKDNKKNRKKIKILQFCLDILDITNSVESQ